MAKDTETPRREDRVVGEGGDDREKQTAAHTHAQAQRKENAPVVFLVDVGNEGIQLCLVRILHTHTHTHTQQRYIDEGKGVSQGGL